MEITQGSLGWERRKCQFYLQEGQGGGPIQPLPGENLKSFHFHCIFHDVFHKVLHNTNSIIFKVTSIFWFLHIYSYNFRQIREVIFQEMLSKVLEYWKNQGKVNHAAFETPALYS